MQGKGFTLIELLIVIMIVTVLAGAMVPMFRTTRLQAQQAKADADLDAIKTAAIMYRQDTGSWPSTGSTGSATGLVTTTTSVTNWSGPYIDDWRNDPWVSAYQIFDSGTGRWVRSRGPNGTAANADDRQIILTPQTW